MAKPVKSQWDFGELFPTEPGRPVKTKAVSQGVKKFFHSNARLFENTSKSAATDFPMHRNDATAIAATEHGMTAFLPFENESKPLQRPPSLFAGNGGELRHE